MTTDEKKAAGPTDSPRLPRIAVPADQGEFMHHHEQAESPCVTGRGEPRCGRGLYALDWAPAGAAELQAP